MAEKKKSKDTGISEEGQAHQDLLQAGLGFYNTSGMGDTSQMKQQAAMFSNYAISQGIDPEKDLNGLTRQVELFGDLVPKEQESARQKLIELTTQNFDYALKGLNEQKAVGLAAKLETPEEELKLEETLSNPSNKLEDVKTAFSKIYESSSLISNYIALNTNKEEVSNAAYGALDRANRIRQSEFLYMEKGKVEYNGRKAITYIAENMKTADEKIANEVKIGIGSNLASIVMARENKKAQKQEVKKATTADDYNQAQAA